MSMPPLPPPKPALDPHARAFDDERYAKAWAESVILRSDRQFIASVDLLQSSNPRFTLGATRDFREIGVVRGLNAWLVSNERRKAR